jgi:hypothetical protein
MIGQAAGTRARTTGTCPGRLPDRTSYVAGAASACGIHFASHSA